MRVCGYMYGHVCVCAREVCCLCASVCVRVTDASHVSLSVRVTDGHHVV